MERIFVKVIEARGLGHMDLHNNEPHGYYVDLGYRDSKQRFSTILKNQDEPFWNQDFIFGQSKDGSNTIVFRVFNKQSELVAESEMSLPNVEQTSSSMQDDWIPLHISKRRHLDSESLRQGERGELHISIHYGKTQAGPASKAAAPQTSVNSPPNFKSLEVRRPLAQPQPKRPIHQFTSKFMPDLYGSFDPRRELLVDSPADRYR